MHSKVAPVRSRHMLCSPEILRCYLHDGEMQVSGTLRLDIKQLGRASYYKGHVPNGI